LNKNTGFFISSSIF